MSERSRPSNSTTGEFDSGDYDTAEFERAALEGRPVRRRRRRKKKSSKSGTLARTLAVVGFCAILVALGIFLGLSFQSDKLDEEQYRISLETHRKIRDRWMEECTESGHSQWTCDRFDRADFEVINDLSSFHCENVKAWTHHCTYVLGEAKVVVAIPVPFEVDGEHRAPRTRAHAIVENSSRDNTYFVAVSENGRVEFRTHDEPEALFVINPATGSLKRVAGLVSRVEPAATDLLADHENTTRDEPAVDEMTAEDNSETDTETDTETDSP